MRAASNPAKLALNAAWTCTFNQIEYLDTTSTAMLFTLHHVKHACLKMAHLSTGVFLTSASGETELPRQLVEPIKKAPSCGLRALLRVVRGNNGRKHTPSGSAFKDNYKRRSTRYSPAQFPL